MKEKILNLKNKILSILKAHKKLVIIIAILILVIIILGVLIASNKDKRGNTTGNLNNLGFSVSSGNQIFYLGFKENRTDGIYKANANGNNIKKVSDDYGLYLNKSGNYLYYLEASKEDNNIFNIVKMKTNGKDKEILVENVDTSKITLSDNWIYYFKNYQLYRVKTNNKNKEQITNKSMLNYEVVGDWIYYSYINDGKYVIAKMRTSGEDITKIDDDASEVFFVSKNMIYYIYKNNNSDTTTYELYKIKANGKNKEKMADISGDVEIDSLNFDGSKLYYSKTNEDGVLSIYSIKINGKDETKIIDIDGYSTMINVNKGKIYYTDLNDNGESDMFVIKTNGKDKKSLSL